MKRWRSPRDPQVWIAAIAALIFVGLAGIWAARIWGLLRGPIEQWPVSLSLFIQACLFVLWIVGALYAGWRALRRAALGYDIDRNALYVVWRRARYAIPLDRVQALGYADDPALQQTTKSVQRFGSGTRAQMVIVATAARNYRLAVLERDQFLRELQARRQLGVVQPVREGWLGAPTTMRMFLGRRLAVTLLTLTVVLNVVLWGVFMWRYPALPETVPLRFDPLGGTAGTRSKIAMLILPLGATICWLGNSVVALMAGRRSWLASELLLLGALVLHVVLLIAAYFLLTGAV